MKARRKDTGTYLMGEDDKRPRTGIVVRSYTHTVTETVPRTVSVDEEVEEDGKIVTKEVEKEIEVDVDKILALVDVLVVLEPEDKKRGATGDQVAQGFFFLTGVQVGEGPGRFAPGV